MGARLRARGQHPNAMTTQSSAITCAEERLSSKRLPPVYLTTCLKSLSGSSGSRAPCQATGICDGNGVRPPSRAQAWVVEGHRIGDFGRASRPPRSFLLGPERRSSSSQERRAARSLACQATGGQGCGLWRHRDGPFQRAVRLRLRAESPRVQRR